VRTRYLSNLGNWVALLSAADAAHVLRVPLLGGLREVKTSCDNALPINNHDLVMSNGVGSIDRRRYALIRQEISRRVLVGAVIFIQKDLDLYAAFVSVKQRFGNRRRGEGIGLDQDRVLGVAQGLHNGVSAVPAESEAYGHHRWRGGRARLRAR
jgi:hypothetical protein